MDVLTLTTWQMVIGCLPLIALALLTGSGWPQWTAGYIFGLAYTAVLANAFAWVLWLYALHHLSAGAAGLGTLAIPVIGVVAAWIQLGEVPSGFEAAGMVPKSAWRRAGELGLLSIEIPEIYEGMDLDKKTTLVVLEELGKRGYKAKRAGG